MSKLFLKFRSNYFNDVDHYRNTYIEYENVKDKTKIKAIYDDKKVELIRNAEFVEDFDRYTVYKKNESANYAIKVIDHDKGEVVFSKSDESKKKVRFYEASGIVYLLFNNTLVNLSDKAVLSRFVESVEVLEGFAHDILIYNTSENTTIIANNSHFIADSLMVEPVAIDDIYRGVLIGENIDGNILFRYMSEKGNLMPGPAFIEEYNTFSDFIIAKGTREGKSGFTIIDPYNANYAEYPDYDILLDPREDKCFAANRSNPDRFDYINFTTGDVLIKGKRIIQQFTFVGSLVKPRDMAVIEEFDGRIKYLSRDGKLYAMTKHDEEIFKNSSNNYVKDADCDMNFYSAGENYFITKAKEKDLLSEPNYWIP